MADNFLQKFTRHNSTEFFTYSYPFCKFGTRDVWKLSLSTQQFLKTISLINQDLKDYYNQTHTNTALTQTHKNNLNSALVQVNFFNR